MQSLDEAYGRTRADDPRSRRVIAGLALVAGGVVAVFAALLLLALEGDTTAANLRAGAIAGTGIPVMLLGVVVVLPASLHERIGVVLGTVLSAVGVGLFWHAYPARWTQTANSLAFETLLVYGLGCAVALWFVFTAIATFRRRNNPHGTVQLEVVRQGKTQTVKVSNDRYRDIVSDGGDAEAVINELED